MLWEVPENTDNSKNEIRVHFILFIIRYLLTTYNVHTYTIQCQTIMY